MPHVEKYTQAQAGLILAHDLRAKSTSFRSADPQLEKNNLYFINCGYGLKQVRDESKIMLSQAREVQKKILDATPHAKRKDLVTIAEWVITCPKELRQEEQVPFLHAAMRFVEKRYGSHNVVAAAMHLDEPMAQPHLQITFVPVDKKGRVCARNVLTRKELQQFHPDLEKAMSKELGREIHILRENDNRTKVSKPLSQFKAETLKQEAECQMKKVATEKVKLDDEKKEIDKKTKELSSRENEINKKLDAAEKLADESASNKINEYQQLSFWARLKSSPIDFVYSVSKDLVKATSVREEKLNSRENELAKKSRDLDTRKRELDEKENEIEEKAKELNKRQSDLEKAEAAAKLKQEQQEKVLSEQSEIERSKLEKAAAAVKREQDQREKELAEQEITIREFVIAALSDRRKSEEENKAASESLEAVKKIETMIITEKNELEILKKERASWLPVEQANKQYAAEQKKANKNFNNYISAKKEAAQKNNVIFELRTKLSQIETNQNDVESLSTALKSEQTSRESAEASLKNITDYTKRLRSELRVKNQRLSLLKRYLSEDDKAIFKAYESQSEEKRAQTTLPTKFEEIKPSDEAIRQAKNSLKRPQTQTKDLTR